ncbi:MAG: hypothetical protein ABW044_05420 [Cellvibrio sp.]
MSAAFKYTDLDLANEKIAQLDAELERSQELVNKYRNKAADRQAATENLRKRLDRVVTGGDKLSQTKNIMLCEIAYLIDNCSDERYSWLMRKLVKSMSDDSFWSQNEHKALEVVIRKLVEL